MEPHFLMAENVEYSEEQLQEIRMGLKDKVNVSVYADAAYSFETMKQIRLSLYKRSS